MTNVIEIGKGETRTYQRPQPKPENKPFPLNLYDDNDDEKYLWIKPRLKSLDYGTLPPNQLAFNFDTRITEDTNRKHDELMRKPDPCHPLLSYIYDHSYHQVLVYENMPKVSGSSNYLCK